MSPASRDGSLWGRIGRGRRIDPRVEAMLAQAPGERPLAWGELTDGQVVLCTDRALHVPGIGQLPWDAIVRAAWSEEFLDLVVQTVPDRPTDRVRLRFEQPGDVPGVVRERVEWTIVASHRAALVHPDGRRGAAMLNARRSPATGHVSWGVVFDGGIDPADPGWRAAADRALLALREQLGI